MAKDKRVSKPSNGNTQDSISSIVSGVTLSMLDPNNKIEGRGLLAAGVISAIGALGTIGTAAYKTLKEENNRKNVVQDRKRRATEMAANCVDLVDELYDDENDNVVNFTESKEERKVHELKSKFEKAKNVIRCNYMTEGMNSLTNIIGKICDDYLGYSGHEKINLENKINECYNRKIINNEEKIALHKIRKDRNKVVHEGANILEADKKYAIDITENLLVKYENWIKMQVR